MAAGYFLFDTALGRCGVAWRGSAVAALQLPERDDATTRASLLERVPEAVERKPPRAVQRAVRGITALLRGEQVDLADVEIDLSGVPPFHRRVYEVARTVPAGQTISYGELARRLGAPGAARAVGQALKRNPCAILVPCHRVLAAAGAPGGFTAPGGIATKLRLLTLEAGEADLEAGSLFQGRERLGFDPELAVAHLRAADERLARLMDAVGPFRLGLHETPSVFLALAEAIVYQQLTARAAETIFRRLQAAFPRPPAGISPERVLRAPDEKLLRAGLSRAKLLALRDLARRTQAGELPTLAELAELSDDEIIERLTVVRGVGRWTVEMLLIFRLGRPDVLPVDDYGIRKGFAVAFRKRNLPTPKELTRYGERWAPYRSVASWYLWRALELPEAAAKRRPAGAAAQRRRLPSRRQGSRCS